jgi:hypothetical protein
MMGVIGVSLTFNFDNCHVAGGHPICNHIEREEVIFGTACLISPPGAAASLLQYLKEAAISSYSRRVE